MSNIIYIIARALCQSLTMSILSYSLQHFKYVGVQYIKQLSSFQRVWADASTKNLGWKRIQRQPTTFKNGRTDLIKTNKS